MKVTDNATYRLMQTNLDRITNDLMNLREQGTTGLKVAKPSDDPGGIRPILTARSQIQQNERYIETMGQAGDKMDGTDGYLGQIENVLARVKEIAVNSVNSSLSDADLNTLADEVKELTRELLDAGNAVIDGKYIFGGYEVHTKPFTENPAYDPDLYDVNDVTTWPYLYNGDHNPASLEITPGEIVDVTLTGNELFLGISNEIAATGYSPPFQGEIVTASPLSVGTPGNDIVITAGTNPPMTISGATDLTDPPGETNYAGKVASLLNQTGTGLVATTNSATTDLGSFGLSGFVDGEDSYTLDVTSGGSTISVTLDGPSGSYDYTLDGMAFALANAPGSTNLTSTSGTLANGVSYDTSSGSLVFTGPSDGSEIELNETIVDTVVTATVPVGVLSGGSQTTYGTIDIATNSSTDVDLAGAGLANLNLAADTLNGSSGKIDLFSVLTRTEEAIRARNVDDLTGPGGSIQAQIDNIETAANQNRSLRSTLGTRSKRVENATIQQESAQIDLKETLSRYQDADILQVYND